MAIYGIGAFFDIDISSVFLDKKIIGTGWDEDSAPEIHQFIKSLKAGDIVYIKSYPPGGKCFNIKGIGIIANYNIISNGNINCGRKVVWINKAQFTIPKPFEKNNVRMNTIYEEFNPIIQNEIIKRIIKNHGEHNDK